MGEARRAPREVRVAQAIARREAEEAERAVLAQQQEAERRAREAALPPEVRDRNRQRSMQSRMLMVAALGIAASGFTQRY